MKCKLSDCHSYANSTGLCPRHAKERRALKCERCGKLEGVEQLGKVVMCEECVVLVEWRRRREEFGELQTS